MHAMLGNASAFSSPTPATGPGGPSDPLAPTSPPTSPLTTPRRPSHLVLDHLATPPTDRLTTIDLRNAVRDLKRKCATLEATLASAGKYGNLLLAENSDLRSKNNQLAADLALAHRDLAQLRAAAQRGQFTLPDTPQPQQPQQQQQDGEDQENNTNDTDGMQIDPADSALAARRLTAELAETRMQLKHAEAELLHVRRQYESLADEHAALNGTPVRDLVRHLQDAHDAVADRDQELDQLKTKLAATLADLDRAAADAKQLERALEATKASAGGASAAAEEYAQAMTELDQQLVQVVHERNTYEAELVAAVEEKAKLQERVDLLESQVDELVLLRQELDETVLRADGLAGHLEEARARIRDLEAQLHVLRTGKLANVTDDPGARKTLLSEVDDDRKRLEMRAAKLAAEHELALRAHSKHMERMRQQVHALTTQANDRTHRERVKHLENEIAKLQAENRELLHRVDELETARAKARRASLAPGATATAATDGAGGDEDLGGSVGVLRLRVEELERNLRQARKKLQTEQMVRSNETAKLRAAEDEVYQRDASISRLNSLVAKYRMRISDLETACDCPKPAPATATQPRRAAGTHGTPYPTSDQPMDVPMADADSPTPSPFTKPSHKIKRVPTPHHPQRSDPPATPFPAAARTTLAIDLTGVSGASPASSIASGERTPGAWDAVPPPPATPSARARGKVTILPRGGVQSSVSLEEQCGGPAQGDDRPGECTPQ